VVKHQSINLFCFLRSKEFRISNYHSGPSYLLNIFILSPSVAVWESFPNKKTERKSIEELGRRGNIRTSCRGTQ